MYEISSEYILALPLMFGYCLVLVRTRLDHASHASLSLGEATEVLPAFKATFTNDLPCEVMIDGESCLFSSFVLLCEHGIIIYATVQHYTSTSFKFK